MCLYVCICVSVCKFISVYAYVPLSVKIQKKTDIYIENMCIYK